MKKSTFCFPNYKYPAVFCRVCVILDRIRHDIRHKVNTKSNESTDTSALSQATKAANSIKLQMPSKSKPLLGIQMKLNPKPAMTNPKNPLPAKPRPIAVNSAFNNDSDEEVEEMPPECRMRMRNIGRDTPTSSGPNSFGKTKQGFVDAKKIFEKQLRNMTEDD